jgi:hypothetical protein
VTLPPRETIGVRNTRRIRKIRSLPAFVAVLVVAVLLFGQLSSLVHRAFVAHARCEHGEFVHVEADGAGHGSRHASAYERDVSLASVHAHEHCAAAAFLPPTAAPQSQRVALAQPGCVSRLLSSAPSVGEDVGCVYSFAPKTSPPAAG